MLAMFNGQPIFGPRGPAGPDGNPIGTIISYMGTSAPTDYLICDGSVYNISDYSKLAEFFKTQFGSENYFGGDGTTTFAVPDMRNLFLRGFHGLSEEQLSGEVGVKQEATLVPRVEVDGLNNTIIFYSTRGLTPMNTDSKYGGNYAAKFAATPHQNNNHKDSECFTSRPVNMAVLYCIKATVAETYDDIYSTEETRIGTWIDGKPLYRKVYKQNSPSSINTDVSWLPIDDVFLPINWYGYLQTVDDPPARILIPTVFISSMKYGTYLLRHTIHMCITNGDYTNKPCVFILEYTKTTDSTPAVFSVNVQDLFVNSSDSVSQSSEKVLTAGVPLPYASIDSIPTSSVSAKLTL